ncbi:MAG TPA: hypothetical protein VLX68_17560 [Chitinivibrionales bacterium]|nr:hypothetical protein [Chitinivibrionales bacterium]
MKQVGPVVAAIFLAVSVVSALPNDSLSMPPAQSFTLLPEYYMQFDMSAFALQRDAFFRRQYLAEPHPDLDFYLFSFKSFIAMAWDVDFLFGLGEVPGDNVFTNLNVSLGYGPDLELRLRNAWVTAGLEHRCFHDIDRKDFPIVWWDRLHAEASSPNARLNTYWRTLVADREFSYRNRVAWQAGAGYYLKELFGWVDPYKIDGNDPFIWDASAKCRYAFYKRRSWIFSMRGETTVGNFSRLDGSHVANGTNWFWREAVGVEAFFIRGARGGCVYALYDLDDMPVQPSDPPFTLGDSRFSRNGLLQIGITVFN